MKRIALLLAAVCLAVLPARAGAAPPGGSRAAEVIEGRYIVVYNQSVERPAAATRGLERAEGFRARFTYGHAVKGFAAALNARQLRALENNPKVDFIAPDRPVEASATLAAGDSAPTGVRRIEAATTTTARNASSVNVAVLDTGIDLAHPDLNAAHGVNCMGSGFAQDDDGHGTHVAGSIAAENDGAGLVGVAPGTKLFAAKVLGADGSGSTSSVVCGIDWATSTRTDSDSSNDIAVANMSLGGLGSPVKTCSTTSDPQHLAICRSTAAGVTYVVAAGNSGWDFDYAPSPDVPAAYPEVLTVTAMSDGDGAPGALAQLACDRKAADDAYASYSNFAATSAGSAHTIAGPGTCIRSTVPGGYGTSSGTSMATPHVAGAVALCLGEAGVAGPCNGMTPAQIITKMRSDAQARPSTYGFAGDPLRPVSGRYYGYLAWPGVEPTTQPAPEPSEEPAPTDTTAPTVSSTSPADGTSGVDPSTSVSVTFNEEMDKVSAENAFSLTKASDGSRVAGTFTWSGSTMIFRPATALAQGADYTAAVATAATDTSGNALAMSTTWRFKTITNVSAAPNATAVLWGSYRSGSAASLAADDASYYEVNSTTKKPYGASWYGRFTGVTNSLGELRITYKGKISRSCTQTLALYHWGKAAWVDVDSRTVGSTPVLIDKAIGGILADYVSGGSGDGELRMRVRCQTKGTFVSSGDLMRISYTKA